MYIWLKVFTWSQKQALLKIIQHCRENYPAPASGQLLGLDMDENLEVTNCFPFPTMNEGAKSINRKQVIFTRLKHCSCPISCGNDTPL